jgi:hypothetical protein
VGIETGNDVRVKLMLPGGGGDVSATTVNRLKV